MTQQQLADKIGVTDRAISKWENGRGLPDLSLMKPLCKELGITLNELISGEKIDKNDYQEKLEENILNTIDYTDKKIKKTNRTFKIVIGIIVGLIVSLIFMFFIDVRMMKLNKPVIFSTCGYQYTPPINLKEDEIYLAIKDYLVEKGDSEPQHRNGEKTFVSMRVYLLEEKEKDLLYYVSAWVMDGKYYLENDELKQDSGSSMPYKFKLEKVNDKFIVTDSRYPRDGSYYADDMKNMFDKYVRNDMDKIQTDGTIDMLEMDVEE